MMKLSIYASGFAGALLIITGSLASLLKLPAGMLLLIIGGAATAVFFLLLWHYHRKGNQDFSGMGVISKD